MATAAAADVDDDVEEEESMELVNSVGSLLFIASVRSTLKGIKKAMSFVTISVSEKDASWYVLPLDDDDDDDDGKYDSLVETLVDCNEVDRFDVEFFFLASFGKIINSLDCNFGLFRLGWLSLWWDDDFCLFFLDEDNVLFGSLDDIISIFVPLCLLRIDLVEAVLWLGLGRIVNATTVVVVQLLLLCSILCIDTKNIIRKILIIVGSSEFFSSDLLIWF